MWIFKKKSADRAIKELVASLSQALGDRLLSVVIYGSRASEEFSEDRSDVNVLILLENASWETLERMEKPLTTWTRMGYGMPVLIQKSELPLYANNLPIEFLDMQDHHKVLFGTDPIQGLQVSRSHLRAQCTEELSVKQVRLRQAIILSKRDPARLRKVLLSSLPSLLTLYRAALRLETEVPKGNKISAAKEFARRAGFDGDCLERLWQVHWRRQTDNVDDLAEHYLAGIGRALTYLGLKETHTMVG